MAQWFVCLTRNMKVMGSSPIKEPPFLEQETLPSLINTGWFQEQISLSNLNKLRAIWTINLNVKLAPLLLGSIEEELVVQ